MKGNTSMPKPQLMQGNTSVSTLQLMQGNTSMALALTACLSSYKPSCFQ